MIAPFLLASLLFNFVKIKKIEKIACKPIICLFKVEFKIYDSDSLQKIRLLIKNNIFLTNISFIQNLKPFHCSKIDLLQLTKSVRFRKVEFREIDWGRSQIS